MRQNSLLDLFLVVQGVTLVLAIIPFLVGLWHYRRAKRIDASGLRATGRITNVHARWGVKEFAAVPFERKGRWARHLYTVEYVCHNGFTRSLTFDNSGLQYYNEGDQLEIAYLRENADIARPTSHLYVPSYTGFAIAGILIAVPGLFALWIWLLTAYH